MTVSSHGWRENSAACARLKGHNTARRAVAPEGAGALASRGAQGGGMGNHLFYGDNLRVLR